MSDCKRFTGRRLVVTGAASGIGRATVLRLVQEGATVVAVDLSEPGLKETAAQAGGGVTCHVLSVADEAAVTALFRTVAEEGPLHGLINLAGVLKASHTTETTVEAFRAMLDVNLVGAFICCREALPLLEKTGGAIVNAASTASFFGHAYMAAYAASKGGVAAMTRTLAWEYIKRGVRVNAVAPGGIATPMTEQIQSGFPEGVDMSLYMHLARPDFQVGEPAQVAAVIAMLASDDSAFMSGEIVRVDGGVHA
ncbi:MAG: SDR family NAD(P)-dependent oxidoreductase [Candidatus Brevundimonas phytovorans]|nr:SDR family oxidoreductase [Brevundimonas sp.]WEK56732.1 MAG: SDR family NAD(P)-dependent oxidoreductase [Brevundimonas sp.]